MILDCISAPYNDRARYRDYSPRPGKHREKRRRKRRDFDASSSSDSDDFGTREERRRKQWDSKRLRDRLGVTSSKEDVSALDVDSSVTWKSIGGLDCHIESLHEMVSVAEAP